MIGRTGRQPFTSLGTFQTLGAAKHAVETRMRWLSDQRSKVGAIRRPKAQIASQPFHGFDDSLALQNCSS
jgi:hypothetical protein